MNFFESFRKEFTFEFWKADFSASISVFLVAVPLCLGIASASNAPLLSGLIAGIIGGIVIGSLSRSPLSVSGPAAGLTTIVAGALSQLGSFEALVTCIVIAGFFQILFGLFRTGTFGRYIPVSVIEGMLAAIGLILIFKQLPHFLGYDAEAEGIMHFFLARDDLANPMEDPLQPQNTNTFTVLWQALHHINPVIAILGFIAISIIIFWDTIISKHYVALYRLFPGILLAVIISTLLSSLYFFLNPGLIPKPTHFVQIPVISSFYAFFSQTQLPSWQFLLNPVIYQVAFTIAFVASIESILSIEAIDKLDPQRRRTPLNRELMAQGFGNMCSGLLGGLPITSVIVRGSVNLAAGAQTKLSSILHGFFLLLTIIFAASLFNQIPLSVLAAVLMATGFKLAHPRLFVRMYRNGLGQFVPFLTTVIAILFTDLMIGVIVGIIVAAVFILRNHHQSKVITVNQYGTLTEVILSENLTFLNKQQIIDTLERIPNHSHVIINGEKTRFLDHDILTVLQDFSANAHHKKIEVLVGGIPQMKNDHSHLTEEFEQSYQNLLINNKEWVEEKEREGGSRFFKNMAKGQSPEFLFVGCSDSRVPIEILTKAEPGDIFVHRNIANTVSLTDANFLAVLEYAVKVLRVKNIIVCGHYECGGIKAALSGDVEGVIGHWISQVKDVYRLYEPLLDAIKDPHEREKRLIELNVIEQVKKIQKTLIVQQAFKTFGFPQLHGWVYDIQTGLIKELAVDDVQS